MRWFGRSDVLGLNSRNADFLARLNPRSLVRQVDDKFQFGLLCERVGLPTPTLRGLIGTHREWPLLAESLHAAPDTVLKPNRGSSGRGVIVLLGMHAEGFVAPNGSTVSWDSVRSAVSDILSGRHSLGDRPDAVLIQERIAPHPSLHDVCHRGTPDLRVLVYRGRAVMAMLRLPTLESRGRANLHQGGVGVGIDMESGRTLTGIFRDRMVDRHPDTGKQLIDRPIPDWPKAVEMAERTATISGLGMVGVDLILDERRGPLVLEANARPGLGIQTANGRGLRHYLKQVDRELT